MRLGVLVKYVGGAVLALLLLAWVMRGTDASALAAALRNTSFAGLFLAATLNLGHNVFRVLRWRVLLEPVRPRLPFRSLFDAVIVGYMTSWMIPGRLGELVRPMLLSARERLPLGPCMGSILADRMLDGLAVVILFVIGIGITPLEGEAARHATAIRAGALALTLAIGLLLALLVTAASVKGRLRSWLAARRGLLGWMWHTLQGLAEGTAALRRPRLALRLGLWTMLAWLSIAVGTWVGVRACGADVTLGAMFIILPLLVLGIAIPTPGGAGGYHAAMKFGLAGLFGVPEPLAVGASLIVHAIVIVPVILLGIVLLLANRQLAGDLREAVRQMKMLGQRPAPEPLPGHGS